jgi:NAD(P)H-hydrate epimerase
MIPVLRAEQTRQADAHTIAHEPISSINLMERAARACADRLLALLPGDVPVVVLAGMGNNGGDGLAIARIVHGASRPVQVFVPRYKASGSADFEINLKRATEAGIQVEFLNEGSLLPTFATGAVVVDALFGTGLQRPVSGWLKQLIGELNTRPDRVIAIDLPSGLFADENDDNDPEAIVQADLTLTLELPKLALFMPDLARHFGEWEVVPIGLDRAFVASLATDYVLLEAADMVPLLPPRHRFDHKGRHGHARLFCGSAGKMGAALLAAKACLRSGPGLVTVHVPQGQEALVHGVVPEAMVGPQGTAGLLTGWSQQGGCGALGLGPGLGQEEDAARLVKLVLQQALAPLVLDADAINLLAANKTWLAWLPPGTILTPHPKEFERLAGKSGSGMDRLRQAREFTRKHQVILVLKGAYTAICVPDGRVYFNPTGNAGMAKGGSGDALTGIITGLLAQGLEPLSAALLGVFGHGLAGDLAAGRLGLDGMLPTDLIAELPIAWGRLRALEAKSGFQGRS